MSEQEKGRTVGLDLLKIILAIQVLTLHFNAAGTGKVLMYATENPFRYIVGGITVLCYPAVNCYVLISAYFMYEKQKDLKNILKSLVVLWLSVLFFSLFGYFVVNIFENSDFVLLEFFKRLIPLCRGTWWFMTVYFVMAILSPYMNILINKFSKDDHKKMLVILLICCSVIPLFTQENDRLGINDGYSLLWFIVLYFTGAYINRAVEKIRKGSFIIYIFLFLFLVYAPFVFCKFVSIWGITLSLTAYNSIFVYIQSIFLFFAFFHLKINGRAGKIISKISSLSLASYLLHCQEDIERFLWNRLKPWEYANSYNVFLLYLCTICVLFASSILLQAVVARFIRSFVKKIKR